MANYPLFVICHISYLVGWTSYPSILGLAFVSFKGHLMEGSVRKKWQLNKSTNRSNLKSIDIHRLKSNLNVDLENFSWSGVSFLSVLCLILWRHREVRDTMFPPSILIYWTLHHACSQNFIYFLSLILSTMLIWLQYLLLCEPQCNKWVRKRDLWDSQCSVHWKDWRVINKKFWSNHPQWYNNLSN